jgi:hypothetical protein
MNILVSYKQLTYLAKTVVFSLLFVITVHTQCRAQNTAKTIEIVADESIQTLVNTYTELNEKLAIKGYRIKIHFSTDKLKAKEAKSKFLLLYPKVPAYEKYDQPNFNIRVGDFRSKLEAFKFLKDIQVEFPTSFIVQDDIEFPTIE